MALVDCRECGRDISTEARECPHCGVPVPAGGNVESGTCKECGVSITVAKDANCPECGEEFPLLPAYSADAGTPVNESGRASTSQGPRTSDEKSDGTAGCLGLFLGPVGLWYKGQWAAGFAWLAMAIIIGGATGGIAAPLFWIGMAIHAYQADPA